MSERDEGMAPVGNDQQSAAWNGWEADHWARHAERYNAMLGGDFNEALFDAAKIDARESRPPGLCPRASFGLSIYRPKQESLTRVKNCSFVWSSQQPS